MSNVEEDTRPHSANSNADINISVPVFNEATIGLYCPLISDFSGDSNKDVSIHSFIKSIEEIAQSCHWPDLVIQWVLKSKLKGRAAIFYEQRIESLCNKTFDDIKLILVKQYAKVDNVDSWKLLMECKCLVGEGIDDYSRRLLQLQNKCNALSQDRDGSFIGDNKVLEIFLRGIPINIQEHMITITPGDIYEAIWWCKKIESKLNVLPKTRTSTMVKQLQEVEDCDSDTVEFSLAGLSIVKDGEDDEAPKDKYGTVSKKPRNTSRTKFTRTQPKQGHKSYVDDKQAETDSRITGITTKQILRDSTTKGTEPMSIKGNKNKHTISIKVRGTVVKCLLDPASDLTLISRETVAKLGLSHKIIDTRPIEIASALNSRSTSNQSIDLYFTLPQSSCRFAHTFRLMQASELLNYSAIIGIDFIIANHSVIDYKNLLLRMWDEVAAVLEPVVSNTPSLQVIHCRTISDEEWWEMSESNNHELSVTDESDQQNYAQLMTYEVAETCTEVSNFDYAKAVLEHSHATQEDLKQLEIFIKKFKSVFSPIGQKLGIMSGFEHDVKLVDETPVKMPQYQIPIKLRGQVKSKLEEYMKSDIIERSTSPWNLPLIIRPKKDGDVRLVLDATAVNKKTVKMDYPIFRISDTFTKLKGKVWFSNIDLKAGYHQIMLSSRSRNYFAFKTDFGKYHYKRLPMGASNSGIYFQMAMETMLHTLLGDNLMIYQDDILIATDTIEEHFDILTKVLTIFKEEGVQINVEKSKLMVREVKFLGHLLRNGTYSPVEENIVALSMLHYPKSKKQLKSFLGRINFYSRFVPALSHIATPLTNLLSSKSKKLDWFDEHSKAFDELKDHLAREPILHYPDYKEKFIISIQVSETALIGVLEQGSDKERRPLGYFSRKLSRAQQNYSPLEKNALAVVDVLEHFHHHISGYSVDVYTSRKAVEYLRGLRDGSTRITDWMLKISKYAPNFMFNKHNSAITHILDLKDVVLDDDEHETTTEIPTAYTDGSCLHNGTSLAVTGIGVYWTNCDIGEFSGSVKDCDTNNRAELEAIIQAIKMGITSGHKKIKIISDSKYAVENIVNHLALWEKNGWKSAKNKILDNVDEFKCINHLSSLITVYWEHIPGHSKNPGNDRAHELANKGRIAATEPVKPAITLDNSNITNEVLAIRAKITTQARIISEEEIKSEQKKDGDISKLIEENKESVSEPELKQGIQLYVKEGMYVYAKGNISISPKNNKSINAIYVPKSMRQQILESIHTSKWVNHAGYVTMCNYVLEHYYWETFRRDIRSMIKYCESCQRNSAPRRKLQILDFEKPSSPGCKIALDIIGPIITSQSGNRYILTIIDMFTRHLTVCTLKSMKVEEVVYAIEKNYITVYGVPECIVTDRGGNFRSEIFSQACKVFKINHYMTTPYHPASNGLVERMNKEIKKKLITLCQGSGKTWDNKIHMVQFAINNSFNSSINTSPNTLTFGENRRFPEWGFYDAHPLALGSPDKYIDELRERLDNIREMSWEFENNCRKKRNDAINKNRILPKFDIGDLVLHRSIRGKTRNHGFCYMYDGPFKILRKVSEVSYEIGLEFDDDAKALTKRVHAERLRPYFKQVVNDTDKQIVIGVDNINRSYTQEVKQSSVEANTENTVGRKLENKGMNNPEVDNMILETNKKSNSETLLHDSTEEVETLVTGDDAKLEINTVPKGKIMAPEHKYYTRSKEGYAPKCYRNYHSKDCICE